MPVSSPNHRGSFLALVACVVMSGLAAGAIWCLLSMFTERDTSILLVPLAAAIAYFLRWQRFANLRGAIGSVVAVLIAFVYAQYLFAAVRMAEMLGFPLRDTLFKMDLPYAWSIAKTTLNVWDFGWLIAAAAVAAATIFYRSAR